MNPRLCFQPSWCTRKSTGRLQPQDTRVYLYTYIYIHTYIWCNIYIYRLEIDLTQIQQLHSQASEWVVLVNHQAFWSPDLWNYLRAQSRLFNHLAHAVLCFITLTLPCHWTFWMANSLGLPKHSSIQFTWELAWMWENCSGSKDGGEAWVWRSTVDFFPLLEGMIYVSFFCDVTSFSSLSWWRFAWHKGLYREAYLTLQASLIRSTWRCLSNLGRIGTLQAGRSTASMASPLRDKMWTRSLRRATWVQQNPTMRFGDSGCW